MQEDEHLSSAIKAISQYGRFFCKFISANDAGVNGAHQEGVYLNKKSWSMFFNAPIPTTGILDRMIKIHIDDWQPFDSRIVYYTSKKEFRVTQFWTNTPFQKENYVGALIIFIPISEEDYKVFLFNREDEIDEFIHTFSLSLINNFAVYNNETGQEIVVTHTLQDRIIEIIKGFEDFPATKEMAQISRDVYREFYKREKLFPDSDLLDWINIEYMIFRLLEKHIYKEKLITPFLEIEPLLEFANTALNRRKSRAGKSLEHHVRFIFSSIGLPFDTPGRTEGSKKPDFLFPSTKDYRNKSFSDNKLIMLGAKTTCKDRWRQVLNEADRIPHKHLLTLQQGISKNQMDEMKAENLQLVVPKPLHNYYPKEYQHRLWTFNQFIEFVKEKYTV